MRRPIPMSSSAQTQFLDVLTRDEATARFREHLRLAPLGKEVGSLQQALGRVLADDVLADVDVPCFHRSNVDGVALPAKSASSGCRAWRFSRLATRSWRRATPCVWVPSTIPMRRSSGRRSRSLVAFPFIWV